MNRRNRAKSSSLFLLELILAILFFAIASAVCVQIFVKSHLLSTDAQALNLAVSECSGATEIIAASDSREAAFSLLQEFYPQGAFHTAAGTDVSDSDASRTEDTGSNDAESNDAVFSIYYDEAMEPCPQQAAAYEMTIRLKQADTMLSAILQMKELAEGSAIYELEADHHLQREAANE